MRANNVRQKKGYQPRENNEEFSQTLIITQQTSEKEAPNNSCPPKGGNVAQKD